MKVGGLIGNENTAVEDVRRILSDIRRQYDEVHAEAARKVCIILIHLHV